MIRRPPRSTQGVSSAASDVYKRQYQRRVHGENQQRKLRVRELKKIMKLKITQIKSTINRKEPQKRTIIALGLGKINRVKIHNDDAVIRGMVNKVKHLVKVENIDEQYNEEEKMELHNLVKPLNKKKKKRLGKGQGSGQGGTAGKGHKGQKARSGGGVPVSFEGGQMPIHRRLPKRGFNNIFKKEFRIVNLDNLAKFDETEFDIKKNGRFRNYSQFYEKQKKTCQSSFKS
eukprot:TRINITY_DN36568_c0_g2_i1.p1 TRINITY_DN36568_c0_g2~~TRINITY_DN36568_c0_g2_i1.p1  ORF type:complete len:230 (+),score=46.52 TRINITY_DN36568_c0_g2_i1:38-727(+)